LADDFGTVDSVAREVIKAENILDYSVRENIAERFAKRLGAGVSQSLTFRLFDGGQPVFR
ncbi:MAG: S49 family peptidase, partial [Candidatus Accumulibacter sp.]|nr:S49 family peptidase [Accumulibacter sp.]